MKTDLHLVFRGACREAFALYEKTFNSSIKTTMTYGEAPPGHPLPEGSADLVMHTALTLGSINLMGCDAPVGRGEPMGGFQITLEVPDQSELERLFEILSKDGSVMAPPTPAFWSPLFTMFKDRFGVGWLITLPNPES